MFDWPVYKTGLLILVYIYLEIYDGKQYHRPKEHVEYVGLWQYASFIWSLELNIVFFIESMTQF